MHIRLHIFHMYLKFVNDPKQEGRRLQIEEEEEEEQPIRPMVQKVRVTDQTYEDSKEDQHQDEENEEEEKRREAKATAYFDSSHVTVEDNTIDSFSQVGLLRSFLRDVASIGL